jgi:hypothetical protein
MIENISFNKKMFQISCRDDADRATVREIFKEKEYRECDEILKN